LTLKGLHEDVSLLVFLPVYFYLSRIFQVFIAERKMIVANKPTIGRSGRRIYGFQRRSLNILLFVKADGIKRARLYT